MRVTVIDFVERGPTRDLFKRKMSPSFANVMPQAIAVWCEELGHEVRYVCYTGYEDLAALADETDLLIAGAFTPSALHRLRGQQHLPRAGRGHRARRARTRAAIPRMPRNISTMCSASPPRREIAEMLGDASPHRPLGRWLSAHRQPQSIPSLRQRWKFAEATLAKAGPIKIVPMIGSIGCPYTCSFCIDATVPYQPLDFDELKADLRFVRTKFKKPLVGWHDPNFGVRFKDYLGAMEEAVPPGSVRSIAEMSLSLLTDENLDRLKKNGFVGMLPGIESWYDYGNKSKTTPRLGHATRSSQVADHVNLVARPHPVRADQLHPRPRLRFAGAEPFELTKRFIDLTPGANPRLPRARTRAVISCVTHFNCIQRTPPDARICFSSSVQLMTTRSLPPFTPRRIMMNRPSAVTS